MATLTYVGAQHRLRLPEATRERANDWIRTQTTTRHRSADQAPFGRMIDFWFMSIAWAVHHGLEPVGSASGTSFVSLGPNVNDIRTFEAWRGDLLAALAVRDIGPDSPSVMDPRTIIDLANRYAEAGSVPLLDHLIRTQDLALPRLYQVAEIFAEISDEAARQRARRVY